MHKNVLVYVFEHKTTWTKWFRFKVFQVETIEMVKPTDWQWLPL